MNEEETFLAKEEIVKLYKKAIEQGELRLAYEILIYMMGDMQKE